MTTITKTFKILKKQKCCQSPECIWLRRKAKLFEWGGYTIPEKNLRERIKILEKENKDVEKERDELIFGAIEFLNALGADTEEYPHCILENILRNRYGICSIAYTDFTKKVHLTK